MNHAIYADPVENLSNVMVRVYPFSFSYKLVYERYVPICNNCPNL